MPLQKRARGGNADAILQSTRSVARTGHKPVAWVPESKSNNKPKEAGREAERLATPNPQEIHHRSLQGPGFQQGWVVEPAEGQPTLIEGSVEVEVMYPIGSSEQQQEQQGVKKFPFPKTFKPVHKALLASTPQDWSDGGIDQIQCKLCPGTELKGWEEFKRHCGTVEAHPFIIMFCDNCGASSRVAIRSSGTARNRLLSAVGSHPSGARRPMRSTKKRRRSMRSS